MANQIVVSAGAKVRNLQDVIIGTSGVLTSLGFDVANGVPRLDVNGKILVSQLPNSVMEYKGTWNAATNTPTLANGTGNQGDVYLCDTAGTVNFGAGPIAFVVGDQVIYSGSIWQRASGATGTVTSVAITESGDSLNITGSPITTSGTINIGFNGTNLQYVNGAGNLTTFPTLITSIGLSMPSAFSVANSPLTANGTIAVTGAGTTAQYIRGDGSLATFPTIATEAQRLITEVYNETGATLSKGTVVYINGGHGNLPTITKALATGDATSAQTYGIVQTDITNMNNGYVVVIGSLTDLDTSAYVEGTQLYLSSTTAGAWTSVKQYAPAHLVYVAIVTRSHPTQGVVEVMIQNGFEMDELHNVSAQSPLNNQGLFYNTSTSLWENKSIATALGYTPADDSLVVKLAGTQTITGVKNFNIGLTLQDGYYPTPALGYVGLGSNGSGITILTKPVSTVYNNNLQFSAASNTYNFPAASGTIALTSDIPSLAGYVTLATTQTITGAKTFSGAVTLTSSVTTNNLTFANSGFFLTLQPPTLSVNRTVTLPNGTGTLALTTDIPSITGLVPYTGATGDVTLGNFSITGNVSTFKNSYIDGSASTNGQLMIKQAVLGSTNYAGYTSFYSTGTNISLLSDAGSSNYKSAILSLSSLTNNTARTYTLPDSDGTIALVGGSGVGTVTSVAALTIGTTGTDLSSSVANSTTTPVITLNVPTASATNRGALSSADWTTFNNKQGTITLTTTGTSGAATFTSNTLNIPNYGSALSGYLPLTGGTLTGALSGTSATFSGNGAFSGVLQVAPTTGTGIIGVGDNFGGNMNAGIYRGGLGVTTSGNYLNIGGYDGVVITTGAAALGSQTTRLTIASTGAATFSSSVTAGGVISTSGAGALLQLLSGGTTTQYQKWQNDGGNYFVGISNSSGGGLLGSQNPYSFCLVTESARDMSFGTANSTRMTIFSDGNVGINVGNTNAGYKLDVNGTGRFTGQTTFGNTLQVTGNANVPASGAGIELAGSTSATGITSFNRTLGTYLASGHNALSYSFAISGVEKFALAASTGAATFSSSVTATEGRFSLDGGTEPTYTTGTAGKFIKSASGIYGGVRVALVGGSAGGDNGFDFYNTSTLVGQFGYGAGGQQFYFTKGVNMATTSGNVGIGTSSPSVPLEVYSTTADVTNNPGNSQIRASASSTKWLSIGYDGANNVAYLQGAENAVSWRPIVLNLNGTTTSPVLIGQASSDGVSKLQVTGAATFSSSVTATSFFESSDSRLKTLIQDNYQTKGIGAITPKLYTKNGKVELGYYAQDFVGILDSAVVKGSDDMLSLSYREVLVAKVYALEQRIKELETK